MADAMQHVHYPSYRSRRIIKQNSRQTNNYGIFYILVHACRKSFLNGQKRSDVDGEIDRNTTEKRKAISHR